MTCPERDELRHTMKAMQDQGACQPSMEEHHAKIMERAKERGRPMPAMPQQDSCRWLKR